MDGLPTVNTGIAWSLWDEEKEKKTLSSDFCLKMIAMNMQIVAYILLNYW